MRIHTCHAVLMLPLWGAALASSSAVQVADTSGFFYGGLGMSHDESHALDATPFAFGAVISPAGSIFLMGFDIAGEGVMRDSTFGATTLRQSLSMNVIVGGNLIRDGSFSLDVAALLGLREGFADCPDSYLGFQCYADSDPITEYEANYGAIVGVSFDNVTLGLRATGESTQALLGFGF